MAIYGQSLSEELAESVKENGVLVPLTLAADQRTIVSGHSRCAAAIKAGLDTVPAVVMSGLEDPLEIEERVIESNRQREKTNAQKAAEVEELKRIYAAKTQRGRPATHSSGGEEKKVVPGTTFSGDARENAAKHVNWSGRTADRAIKVKEAIQEAERSGEHVRAEKLTELLNQSVRRAYEALHEAEEPEEGDCPQGGEHEWDGEACVKCHAPEPPNWEAWQQIFVDGVNECNAILRLPQKLQDRLRLLHEIANGGDGQWLQQIWVRIQQQFQKADTSAQRLCDDVKSIKAMLDQNKPVGFEEHVITKGSEQGRKQRESKR